MLKSELSLKLIVYKQKRRPADHFRGLTYRQAVLFLLNAATY